MSNTMIVKDDVKEILAEIKRARELQDAAKKAEKYHMQRLYNIVNEHDELIQVDENGVSMTLATWKYSKNSERFDAKSFKDANPDIYQLYVKIQAGSRRLEIKE